MVSVGSSAAFSNIMAGLVMTYMRSFRVGDRIRIGDVMGDVEEKTLLVTRIRTFHGETVTMPNSALMAGNTINYTVAAQSADHGLRLHTQVTIGYDVPWRQVHGLLLGAAAATEGVLKDPAPFVLQKGLEDFYVTYEINVHTDEPRKMNFIYSVLHQNIQDAFAAAGVEIMSPHYRAERDGNALAVPPAMPQGNPPAEAKPGGGSP
jgi:small-conductance mechanosensitive channel